MLSCVYMARKIVMFWMLFSLLGNGWTPTYASPRPASTLSMYEENALQVHPVCFSYVSGHPLLGAVLNHWKTSRSRAEQMDLLVGSAESEHSIGQTLYRQFIAKSVILHIKAESGDDLAAARENDALLRRLRYSADARSRQIYDAIEQAYLEHVQEFVRKRIAPRAKEIERLDVLPLDLFVDMAREGLIGTHFAQEDGGSGLSTRAWLKVNMLVSEVSSGVASGALNVLVSVGVDPIHSPLPDRRAEALRRHTLRHLLHGEAIVDFCLSEHEAGSDNGAIAMQISGRKLSGDKTDITGGAVLPEDYEAILKLPDSPEPSDIEPLKAQWPRLGDDMVLWAALRRQVTENVRLYRQMEHWHVVAARTERRDATHPYRNLDAFLVLMKEVGVLPQAKNESLEFHPKGGGTISVQKLTMLGQFGSGTSRIRFDQVVVDPLTSNMGTMGNVFETLSRGGLTMSAQAFGILRAFRRLLTAAIAHRASNISLKEQVTNVRDFVDQLDSWFILYSDYLFYCADQKDDGAPMKLMVALTKMIFQEEARTLGDQTRSMLAALGFTESSLPSSDLPSWDDPYNVVARRLLDVQVLTRGEGSTQIQQKIALAELLRESVVLKHQKETAALMAVIKTLPMAGALACLLHIRYVMFSYLRVSQDIGIPGLPFMSLLNEILPVFEARLQMLMTSFSILSQRGEHAVMPIARAVAIRRFFADTVTWLECVGAFEFLKDFLPDESKEDHLGASMVLRAA